MRFSLTAAMVGLSIVAMSASAVAQEADPAAQFTGTFKYAGGQKQKASLVTAIEAATDDMNFIVRPIARSRLKDTQYAYKKLTISISGGKVSISRDGAKPIVTTNGGSVMWTREDDSKFKVTQKLSGNKLTQSYVAEEGSRYNTFILNKSGEVMTMRVKVVSPKLPQPLKYSLTYKK